jgi:putative transposase
VKCRFIALWRTQHAVSLLCRVLGISRSAYYAWWRRPESRRTRANRRLLVAIRTAHHASHSTYGSPRIYAELRAQGERCGRHRIARLMRLHGIRAKQARRFRVTTDSSHGRPVAANLLGRRFVTPAINRCWVTDLTYVPTHEGWLYLAVVLDLYSRRVIGWAMQPRMSQELVLAALRMAIAQRRPRAGLLHHSDQGGQYAGPAYQALLTRHGICPSMSRRGDCWDNTVAESFFKTLKTELVYHRSYRTRAEARADLFVYIEQFYNRRRRHSFLGYRSPADYESSRVA